VSRTRIVTSVLALVVLLPAVASGHGAGSTDYRTTITSIEPAGLPIDVRVANGDQMRFENVGDKDLIICGYLATCEPFAKLGPSGVFENHNSKAYYANLDTQQFGSIPDDVGVGAPKWVLVRREPAFLTYHDHRSHWMGGSLPPNVDASDPDPQLVNRFEIQFRYGSTDGVVHGRLEYVAGKDWFGRYGEFAITGVAILGMLVVFVLDARRRRRERSHAVDEAAAS
jgi:hypothetical protein